MKILKWLHNKFHVHTWKFIRKIGNNKYYQCETCRARKYQLLGEVYSPVDWNWLGYKTLNLTEEEPIIQVSQGTFVTSIKDQCIQVADKVCSSPSGDFIKYSPDTKETLRHKKTAIRNFVRELRNKKIRVTVKEVEPKILSLLNPATATPVGIVQSIDKENKSAVILLNHE